MHLPSDLRYPLGRFLPQAPSLQTRHFDVRALGDLPKHLVLAVDCLNKAQLETPYREGGWTVCQLVHHVADSHLNAYARLRLALTEDWPIIKPYDEALWAELPDARTLPVEHSLALLVPLHLRWSSLLQSLEDAAWSRGYVHPENGPTTIEAMTALYSWHGRHHTAHVLALRECMGW